MNPRFIVGNIGYYSDKQDGLEFRTAEREGIKNQGDIGNVKYQKYWDDKFYPYAALPLNDSCVQSKRAGEISVALIGDSHAAHLLIGLSEALSEINIVQCSSHLKPDNEEFNKFIPEIISDKNIKIMVHRRISCDFLLA